MKGIIFLPKEIPFLQEFLLNIQIYLGFPKGAIMAVGASEPTLVGTKDGRIGLKTQMQVRSHSSYLVILCFIWKLF